MEISEKTEERAFKILQGLVSNPDFAFSPDGPMDHQFDFVLNYRAAAGFALRYAIEFENEVEKWRKRSVEQAGTMQSDAPPHTPIVPHP